MILTQVKMENTKFIVYILMIIRTLVQEKTFMVKVKDLNIVFGIMEMILTDYGSKKKKSKIITVIKENALFQ